MLGHWTGIYVRFRHLFRLGQKNGIPRAGTCRHVFGPEFLGIGFGSRETSSLRMAFSLKKMTNGCPAKMRSFPAQAQQQLSFMAVALMV
jgi:hypothetical protein